MSISIFFDLPLFNGYLSFMHPFPQNIIYVYPLTSIFSHSSSTFSKNILYEVEEMKGWYYSLVFQLEESLGIMKAFSTPSELFSYLCDMVFLICLKNFLSINDALFYSLSIQFSCLLQEFQDFFWCLLYGIVKNLKNLKNKKCPLILHQGGMEMLYKLV